MMIVTVFFMPVKGLTTSTVVFKYFEIVLDSSDMLKNDTGHKFMLAYTSCIHLYWRHMYRYIFRDTCA